MKSDDLKRKVAGYLELEKKVASATDFKPEAACRVGASRFSTGIEIGGVLGSYEQALHFFEAAQRAFSVLPRERCLDQAAASESDEERIHEAWQASFAIAIVDGALKRTDVPDRQSMQAAVDALSLLVGNGLVHDYKDRADMYLSAGILDVLCLAYLLPLWGFGKIEESLVDRCVNAKVHKPFEAIHRAASLVVRGANDSVSEFDRAYRSLARASNFKEGLVAGMRIIHLFHLSLMRNEGRIRPSIERLLPENEH